MIDDDNHPDDGGFVRLLQHDVDIVAAPCRNKQEPIRWPIRWLTSRPLERDAKTGLLEVETVGTGILRITREAIEKIIAADGEDIWYVDANVKSKRSYEMFRACGVDHVPIGEDVQFCLLARKHGMRIWVDPDIVTNHYGYHNFRYSVGTWLSECVPDLAVTDLHGIHPKVTIPNSFSALNYADKSVALVIASRGNPQALIETVKANLTTSRMPTTKIVIGLDEDDPTLEETLSLLRGLNRGNVYGVVNPRQDSLGAVYNLCAADIAADLYINAADDAVIATAAWDVRLLQNLAQFPDGICTIAFGKMPVQSMLPALMATSRKLIDKMGFWLQPYTPFWWTDTWLFEVSVMIGRVLHVDLDVAHVGNGGVATRGMRDVSWWAAFFDAMRAERARVAKSILADDDLESSPEAKAMLIGRLDDLCASFAQSNAVLRDEQHVNSNVVRMAHDAPDDPRYRRIKARAEELLAQQHEETFHDTAPQRSAR